MLSYIELAAAANAALATVSLVLCGFFIHRLWGDMLDSADVGSVGFWLIFATVGLFDLWDLVAYVVLAWPGPSPEFLNDLTVFKPPVHGLEIIGFLLLFLHFRKTNDHQDSIL